MSEFFRVKKKNEAIYKFVMNDLNEPNDTMKKMISSDFFKPHRASRAKNTKRNKFQIHLNFTHYVNHSPDDKRTNITHYGLKKI